MRALISSNPICAQVQIIRVDWNRYRNSPLTRDLKVGLRATLVMFRDGEEGGRVVTDVSGIAIEALFNKKRGIESGLMSLPPSR